MSGEPSDGRAANPGGGRRLVLRSTRTGRDVRHLEATLAPDGAVLIEGQDLGPAVERIWGEGLTEYEWAWRIAPADVPAAVAAIGGQVPPCSRTAPRGARWCADDPATR